MSQNTIDMVTAPEPEGWHAVPAAEAAVILGAPLETGLVEEETRLRLRQFGPNEVTARRGHPAWLRLLLQFHQPFIYVLLAATAVTLGLGEYVDAGVIFGVVLLNTVVGFIQENRAEKAIEALARMVVTEATVRREGRRRRVNSRDLVSGDVVWLQAGDRVPADLRLVWQRNLQVDESSLTGEPVPVQKQTSPLPAGTPLAERTNMLFAGTLVTAGQAEGLVVATGDRTETGRVAALVAETHKLDTPLTRRLAFFSRRLLFIILSLAALTFLAGITLGQPAGLMFRSAVALAVAAVPEGVPTAVTIVLAVGVARMARRRAIIRKLPAVETLGSTTVICSDKTGTLTQNCMTVREIFAGDRLYHLTGSGYSPDGKILHDGQPAVAADNLALAETLRAGSLCNDAHLTLDGGSHLAHGDPTEAALLVAARKAGLEAWHAEHRPRRDTIPFESELKFMATLHDTEDGQARVIYVKGAVEAVLGRCGTPLDARGQEVPLDWAGVMREASRMADDGLRVLAFAKREVTAAHAGLTPDDVADGLTFLGLQGLLDPLRPEAIAAVHQCQAAGITVKMITGDNVLTALAIARRLGLAPEDSPADAVSARTPTTAPGTHRDGLYALTGTDLAAIPADDLPDFAQRAVVFARMAPEQKLQIVNALQARGHVTAMTGDGVNDAPALKQADIGIAMGQAGTEVAREAADMVLTNDNFATIEAAIEEGRSVFDNLTKYIIFTIPTNAGEAGTLLVAILFGLSQLPILPVQALWINMATSLLLGVMLVFEPKEPDLMRRPPRDPTSPLVTRTMFLRTVAVTLLMLAGAFGLFAWEQGRGAPVAAARTTVVNVIVLVEVFYLFACRSLTRSAWALGLLSNPLLLGGVAAILLAQVAFTYWPPAHRLFQSAPLRWDSWLAAFGVGLVAYVLVELEKAIRFRVAHRGGAPSVV